MNLFLDCEFDGYKGDLISMALVSEDGDREFYEINSEARVTSEWVKANVVPKLGDTTPVTYEIFQRRLCKFLKQFPQVHVVADYPDDIQYFCSSVITGPGEWFDLDGLTFEIDRDLGNDQSEVLYNALHDARAIRDCFLRKEGVLD